MSERRCEVDGCDKLGQHTGQYRIDGSVIRRRHCSRHHGLRYGIGRYEYLRHRKTHCENKDGRLGFVCTSTIVWEGQLQVDHVNGIHSDNRPGNLQTLCANCHAYKTFVEQDWLDKTAA